MADKYILLDRDGTIIHDKHYLSDPDGVELLPGAAEGLRALAEMGFKFAVLTNQSGVGRGYFNEASVHACNARLSELLAKHGVRIEAYFHCPHTPDDDCGCRKPKTGLMDQAAESLGFDPAKSYMVGDKVADIGLGVASGAVAVLVRTGKGQAQEERCRDLPHHVADDLRGVAEIVAKLERE